MTQSRTFEPGRNYLRSVDAFADSGSRYGMLNLNGSVYQWNDLAGQAGQAGLHRGLRGGFWAGGAVTLQKSTFSQVAAVREGNDTGFRLVGPAVVPQAPPRGGQPGIDRAAFVAAIGAVDADGTSIRRLRC
ncbi:MAG: hypothetical protein ACKORK_09365 [Gemmatimonadota bacterium]